jgi:sec-independent protein translocase protein TatA
MLGGIGIQEIVIILIVGLLVFGATRLPKIARSLGQGIKEFKKTVKDLDDDNDEDNVRYVDQGPNYAQTQPYGQYQGQQYAQYQQPGQSYGPQGPGGHQGSYGPAAPQQGAPVPPGQQQQTAQPTQTQFTAPQTPAPETGASQPQATGQSGVDEKSSI